LYILKYIELKTKYSPSYQLKNLSTLFISLYGLKPNEAEKYSTQIIEELILSCLGLPILETQLALLRELTHPTSFESFSIHKLDFVGTTGFKLVFTFPAQWLRYDLILDVLNFIWDIHGQKSKRDLFSVLVANVD